MKYEKGDKNSLFLTLSSQGLLLDMLVGDVSPVEDVPPFCLGTDWLLSWTNWRLLKFRGWLVPPTLANPFVSPLGWVDDCCKWITSICWWDAALPFNANCVAGIGFTIFPFPFPPQLLQYFFPLPWFPFIVPADFVIEDGEDGLELLGDDTVDFFEPWEEARGDAFLEDRPAFLTDPAGDGVPLDDPFSPFLVALLVGLVF